MVPFAIGMAISIVGGIAFGVVMARVWLFEYIVDPYVNAPLRHSAHRAGPCR